MFQGSRVIKDSQISDLLHSHHLFSSLAETELEQLLRCASVMGLPAHEILFHQGDDAERFYLIVKGHLRLYRTSVQGQEKVIEVVREGSSFAEALMFNQQANYPVSAQAVSDCKLISFDSHAYLHLLRNNPSACIAIMANMSHRLRKHVNEVELLSVQNAQNRLLLFLLRNMQTIAPNQGLVTLDIPKRMLASRLSIQPETFSRLIKKMVTEGLILESHGEIHIRDVSQLYADANIPMEDITAPSTSGSGADKPRPKGQSIAIRQLK
ncbi:Crp/Fnr family transcriptional regulator [Shewanella sp. AS16]|uniref:Crp/Fnr family transcriptional regulator n=1 Tax=Shewanella sp. AS16 TaxID=2907625 RepID=UPI001F235520|nr:Crp/Fnr family transcriptional regulator [Shewanella sp. AS16]MCE9685595.1 Crp/Fnr family transcriptional regulator [Shewanella sp. AS16]